MSKGILRVLLAVVFVVGCRVPDPVDKGGAKPVPIPASADYTAGNMAGKSLLHGTADVLDGVAGDIEAGSTDSPKLYKKMADGMVGVRKTALEPLEDQLDRSAPPDKITKGSAKPFRDAAKGLREAVH